MLKIFKVILIILFLLAVLVPSFTKEYEFIRKLKDKDIKEIKTVLKDEDINQNINLKYSSLVYINPFGQVYFVALNTNYEELDKCMFLLIQEEQVIYKFEEFYGNQLYSYTEITDVSFMDMNDDGSADLTVLADGMTGIGPDGAIPYPSCSIYFNDLKGSYKVKEKLNEEITDKLNNDANFKNIKHIYKFMQKKNEL